MDTVIAALIGGLATLAGTLYVQRRERRSDYRRALYEQRVEAFGAMMGLAGDVFDQAVRGIAREIELTGGPLDAEARTRIHNEIIDAWNAYATEGRRWSHIVPKDVARAWNDFERAVHGVTLRPGFRPNFGADPAADIHEAHKRVIDALRKALGVEALGKDLEDLFGVSELDHHERPPAS